MLARVSTIEAFRRWRHDDDSSVEDFIAKMESPPSEAMLAGTAFHKALEQAVEGEHEKLEAMDYTFLLADMTLQLPSIREVRGWRQYGRLTVTGQLDAIHGKRIIDHKTTTAFNPDGYLEGCQWRFYLDIFGADVFRWNVFELSQEGEKTYRVTKLHVLEQYRYPALHSDCMQLASDFYEFAVKHMPNHKPNLEAA